MYSRIKLIRTHEGLTQAAFAEKIGLSRNFVAMIEIGQRDPSDRTISDICRIFSIQEDWLRYGLEPMRAEKTEEELIAEMVGSALSGSSRMKKAVIKLICSKTDEELQALEDMLRQLYEDISK